MMPMPDLPRRSLLIGAAVVPLAACGAPDNKPAPQPATGQVLASTSDIPVGSGKMEQGVVVTQPTAGVFKAFVPKCTHAGCQLSDMITTTIDCPCHGSKFELDGSVAHGPAVQPLTPIAITVRGTSIVTA